MAHSAQQILTIIMVDSIVIITRLFSSILPLSKSSTES